MDDVSDYLKAAIEDIQRAEKMLDTESLGFADKLDAYAHALRMEKKVLEAVNVEARARAIREKHDKSAGVKPGPSKNEMAAKIANEQQKQTRQENDMRMLGNLTKIVVFIVVLIVVGVVGLNIYDQYSRDQKNAEDEARFNKAVEEQSTTNKSH